MEQLNTYKKIGGAILVGSACVWLQENIAPGVHEVFRAICAWVNFPQTQHFSSKLNIKCAEHKEIEVNVRGLCARIYFLKINLFAPCVPHRVYIVASVLVD